MATKYRMTGCARFFLVLLILIPIAYFSASFITGEDGVEFIRNLFGSEKEPTEIQMDNSIKTEKSIKDINELKKELNLKEQRIEQLEEKNKDLRDQLEELKMEENPQSQ